MEKISRRKFLKASGGIAISVPFLRNIEFKEKPKIASDIIGKCQVVDYHYSSGDTVELHILLDREINLSKVNGCDFILGGDKAFSFYDVHDGTKTSKIWIYNLEHGIFNAEKLKGKYVNYKIAKRRA